MTAAPRGPDLSFLNEEEARAIFQVLQRDAELRRAEKSRVSKLLKRKKSEKGLRGVTGEWFEEIKRKKFQNYTDVNRMLKPPLEHQLRKSKNIISHYKPACHIVSPKMSIKLDFPGIKDHKELKMSSRTNHQAQKNTSTSFLGFRSPFAWLSSFRKSRKTQTQKQPRYDSSAHPSSKVEEMATAEICNSPMSAETSGHSFDTNQNEMMEKSTQEWNEQLEKEFFSVLNDLDDQLAQEQAPDPLDRTDSTSSASNVQASAFSTSKRQTASRGQQRNEWSDMPSTFFPDGLRTLRAKDEHRIFIRPRKLHSAYINWHQTAFLEDCKYGDPLDGNPRLHRRRLSAVSFGRSSEGSLYPPSVTQNSGFRHKSCMHRDTAGRSYSVCSLRRCPSSASSDQLSASSLEHSLARESKNGFVPRFGRQNPKRIPLSSIVWNNTPDSPGQTSTPETMFRTQSLMEFHAADHGRYPSSLQETKKYTCYHPKHRYRRSISGGNCFSRVSCPDEATSPLSFDNWENYPLYKSENNLSRSYYRDISSHGKLYGNRKNSYGKRDRYPSWADTPHCYNDEAFLSPDASFDMFMANLNDQQWAHTKNTKFGSQRLENDFHMYSPENTSIKRITRSAHRAFSEFTEGCQPWLSCNSSVSSSSIRSDESVFPKTKDQTKPAGLNRNSAVVTQRSTKADFTQLGKAEGMKQPDEDMPLQSDLQQADTSYIKAQSFSSTSPASAVWQRDVSLFNTVTSRRQMQVTARGDAAKIYTSNGDKRNVQMKENDCPPNSVFSRPPRILAADESRKEHFLPSQKEWEHNLHYAAQRENIKQDNRSAEAINQDTPKRQSSLLNVASAPSTGKSANCHSRLSCPPECLSGSSQSFPQALSHKDNSKCLGTTTSSSVNCTVTGSQAEGGKEAQVSRIGVTKQISQKTLQNASTLVTKDCNGQFTTSAPQNGNLENIYPCTFDGDPNTSENSLSYFCVENRSEEIRSNSPSIERLHKQDSFPRHTYSSGSITGSPAGNNSKSPDPHVIYYTLPRKSASIAGSIMSDTPISLPRENRTTYNCLRSETPFRVGTFYSNQRDVSCLDSNRSFSTSASLNDARSNKDYPRPFTKSVNDSVSSSTSVDLTDRCRHLSRRESSVFSDYKEGGNFLQKYKTTSTFTVCVDEDHVKYHELVSIYYTLPRRHSKTFCSLFRDNTEDADLPGPKENAQSPRIQNTKNEDHLSLTNVFSPTTSEKEEPSYSSDQVSSAVVTPQNLRTVFDSEKENSHLSLSCKESVSMVHSRKDNSADLSLSENVLSDMVTKEIYFGGPQTTAIVTKSGKTISDASGSQKAKMCLKEKKEVLQRATPLTSTLSTPPKPGRRLENPLYSTSTNKNTIQKGNSESCCQPPKVNTKKNLNSLLLRSGEKASLGRSCKTEHVPVEDMYRDSTEVKQRVNFLHQTTPLYNNKCGRLQLRADNSRKNANYLNSCSKVFSESQSKTSEVSTASSADPLLQLDKVVSTDTDEVKDSKIKKEQNSQSNRLDKVYSGLQESERHREGRLNIEVLGVAQDQKITQTEDENKLLSDFTRDKVKDIEKRKNRPSIKNKLAAVYKTSRKFSSKNLPPKPHISNIFSQNNGNATSLEVNTSLDSLISMDSHESFLQLDNENQNHSLDPDKNTLRPKPAENKKTENHNDPFYLVNNTSRRSFTSSYAQKEAVSPKKTTVKVENRPRLTTLFPDKAATTRNKNSQTLDLRLESKSQPMSPSATTSDPQENEKGRASGRACTPPLPLLTNKNSNSCVNSCLQAGTCPEQNLTSQTELGQCQNASQSATLENANLNSYQLRKSHAKSQRERHLSEGICAQDFLETSASGSNILPKDGIHGKRFKSYSELLSCDENENWASDDEKCYSTRNLMYPSVEFGIFGKEQQLAFLENIKRSLTEGRLWRPCLLNNPSAFRDRETSSINRAELLSSSSAGSKMSSAASSPRELTDIYGEDPAAYSDSDSDTTTDDEYYLDEVDKESEL